MTGLRYRRFGTRQNRQFRSTQCSAPHTLRPHFSKKEGKQEERKSGAKKDSVAAQIRKVWNNPELKSLDDWFEYYEKIEPSLKDINYSKEDVYAFIEELALYQHEKEFEWQAGVFLSALINTGKDDKYSFSVSHLPGIGYIGFKNEKNLIIEGNLTGDLGNSMISGTIILIGNVNGYLAAGMEGGEIVVWGDVYFDETADSIEGGKITIFGNVLGTVDFRGTLYVYGDILGKVDVDPGIKPIPSEIHVFGNIKFANAAIVYHKGKLRVEK